MSLLGRRGFTLVELMIAIVLLGIFSAGLYKVLLNNQRTFAAQTQRIDLQQNIRAAASILPAEFREMDAGDSDIVAMDSASITFRAMRQLGFICLAPVLGAAGNITFTVRQAPMYGNRQTFTAGDSLLIYYEGNPASRSDDQWVRGGVVSSANLNCPAPDNKPGFQLVVTMRPWPASAPNVVGAITSGSPLRRFDVVKYYVAQSGTDNFWYLTQQVNGATGQPLVGPLSGATGLALTYYDSTGTTATADRTMVALIGIKVRARTTQLIRQANDAALAYKQDSITVQVAVRNNPRCGPRAIPPRTCN